MLFPNEPAAVFLEREFVNLLGLVARQIGANHAAQRLALLRDVLDDFQAHGLGRCLCGLLIDNRLGGFPGLRRRNLDFNDFRLGATLDRQAFHAVKQIVDVLDVGKARAEKLRCVGRFFDHHDARCNLRGGALEGHVRHDHIGDQIQAFRRLVGLGALPCRLYL